MINIPTFIVDAIDGGVRVTVERDKDYGIRFDMNLMAKSHMYIVYDQDCWWALMRYDEKFEVDSVDTLKRLARHGMHGRDFIDSAWAEYLLTDEQRAERQMAYDALAKLTPEEQNAVKGYFVK